MSEHEWIARHFAPLASSAGAAGLTDDVAQLAIGPECLIATTDAIVEGVHVLRGSPVDTVARKLVRVNVSDILAKGAVPVEALLVLGWPAEWGEAEFARFADALGDELDVWGAALVGGDFVTAPTEMFAALTLTGRCLGDGPVRRSGTRSGDGLWVSGEIGAGVLGLEAAQAPAEDPALAARYHLPELPPLAIADLIAKHASAAMDISDGLLGDALKLAEASRICVELDLAKVPYVRQPSDVPACLRLATGGDDYQALVAVPAAKEAAFQARAQQGKLQVTRIGSVVDGAGLSVSYQGERVELPDRLSYEHR